MNQNRNLSNQIADGNTPKKQSPAKLMNRTLMTMESQIEAALPKATLSAERLIRLATTEISKEPKLALCTEASFLGAVMTTAALGLELVALGQAYLIPFRVKDVMTCTLIVGWQGYVALMNRSDKVKFVDVQNVHEKDTFEESFGIKRDLIHIPAKKDGRMLSQKERGKIIAFYAIAYLSNGECIWVTMTKEDAMDHGKKYSKSFSSYSSGWQTDPDAMCRKTCILKLAKMTPKATEATRAAFDDENVKFFDKDTGDVFDNYEGEAEEIEAEVVGCDPTPTEAPKKATTPKTKKKPIGVPSRQESSPLPDTHVMPKPGEDGNTK